jgi:hypothetical protein
MKCEVCLEHLEEYFDGELVPAEREQVATHLISCAACSDEFATLSAEQEIFARYDREIEVPPFLWTRIAEHCASDNRRKPSWIISFAERFGILSGGFAAGVAIVLFAAVVVAGILFAFPPPKENIASGGNKPTPQKTEEKKQPDALLDESKPREIVAISKPKTKVRQTPSPAKLDHSDVLSSDLGYLDIDERETAMHIEQTENLLRSIRNVPLTDDDEEIDVTYDKALSRRLLNENVVLRREAEIKAKFPTKTLLADLEPFLIDIANLPDHARPEEVRAIKERVQKTEIVAALVEYQDRGTNNR